MQSTILQGLSDSQLDAVTTIDGPVLVLAGAGSGKTRVITRRIAYMLEKGVYPDQVMAVTFTNKAANEMAERVRKLVEHNVYFPYMGTFHSVCYRLLLKHGERLGYKMPFVIFDADKSKVAAKEAAKRVGIKDKKAITEFARRLTRYVERYKNQGMTRPDQPKFQDQMALYQAAVYYTEILREANAMDFGDLLLNTLVLLQEHSDIREYYQGHIRYVMVDEFQDTNPVQYHIVRTISRKYRNICVVGDDDQSIYSWRGATISNILNFDKDFDDAKVVYLVDNYRSNAVILQAASHVVSRNTMRHKKVLRPTKAPGNPIIVHVSDNPKQEAAYIANAIGQWSYQYPNNEIAVFFRTNAQSRPIEEVFGRRHIPYRLIGAHRFYERKEVKDVLAYLELVVNPNDDIALRRVINVPARGIGAKTVEKAAQAAADAGTSLFDALLHMKIAGVKGQKVRDFLAIIKELHDQVDDMTAFEMLQAVLDRTQYLRVLQQSQEMEDMARAENLEQLMSGVSEFVRDKTANRTADYLANINLTKGETEDGSRGVNLMTVHASKGLEFSAVIIAGLVDGIFPHKNSLNDDKHRSERLEEERRLMYVAMTRAKEKLVLSTFRSRRLHGQSWEYLDPSRFLDEIPKELCRET